MSYFNQLKLQAEIEGFSLEDYRPLLPGKFDLESSDKPWYKTLYEYIKKFITWCKEKLIQLGKFISEKLGRWFRGKLFKRNVSKINFIKNTTSVNLKEHPHFLIELQNPSLANVKDDDEYNRRIEEAKKKSIELIKNNKDLNDTLKITMGFSDFAKGAVGANYNYWLFFSEGGKIRDINEVIKNTKRVLEFVTKDTTMIGDIIKEYKLVDHQETFKEKNGNDKFVNYIQHFLVPACLGVEYQHVIDFNNYVKAHQNFNVDVDKLLDYINGFDGQYTTVEKEIGKLTKDIEKKLNDAEKQLSKINDGNMDYEKIRWETDKLRLAFSVVNVPTYYLSNFARLISKVGNLLFSERYVSTTTPPASPIYHLSFEGQLGKDRSKDNYPRMKDRRVLMVRTPLSGGHENLPPRISFAPKPELCCYGLSHYFKYEPEATKEEKYEDLYLYQGVQVKGKTRYLKPEIVKVAVSSDAYHSQEICVSSDIEIKLINKVRVYYYPSKPLDSPTRYRIEYIS